VKSYPVGDRTQVAELDPSMLVEEEDEPEEQPCPHCGNDDHEDLLLLCDGCDGAYHTYCVGLDSVPAGNWYCEDCSLNQMLDSAVPRTRPIVHHTPSRRTRGQRRRARNTAAASSSGWARVWQSVWDRLNLDLDFPFDDEEPMGAVARREAMELREWQRRCRVAQRQGGRNRFRETAPALLEHTAPTESVEDIQAWNALEKARDIDNDPSPRSRKRKSTTASPREPESSRRRKRQRSNTPPTEQTPTSQPQRRLKRPQTRRARQLADASSDSAVESSEARRRSIPALRNTLVPADDSSSGYAPSFLQSLLTEVESSSAPDETKGRSRQNYLNLSINNPGTSDCSSPQGLSPGVSPTGSNHATPRALSRTPPPSHSPRPSSPGGLSSTVEPLYPSPKFSPVRSPEQETLLPTRSSRSSKSQPPHRRMPRERASSDPRSDPAQSRSQEASPTRLNMALSTKERIQKLVKEALRTPYQNNEVSKDQYTDINRSVSRMLYEKVGDDSETLLEGEAADHYRKMASLEVERQVKQLASAAKEAMV
jgi:hypothetical protein